MITAPVFSHRDFALCLSWTEKQWCWSSRNIRCLLFLKFVCDSLPPVVFNSVFSRTSWLAHSGWVWNQSVTLLTSSAQYRITTFKTALTVDMSVDLLHRQPDERKQVIQISLYKSAWISLCLRNTLEILKTPRFVIVIFNKKPNISFATILTWNKLNVSLNRILGKNMVILTRLCPAAYAEKCGVFDQPLKPQRIRSVQSQRKPFVLRNSLKPAVKQGCALSWKPPYQVLRGVGGGWLQCRKCCLMYSLLTSMLVWVVNKCNNWHMVLTLCLFYCLFGVVAQKRPTGQASLEQDCLLQ